MFDYYICILHLKYYHIRKNCGEITVFLRKTWFTLGSTEEYGPKPLKTMKFEVDPGKSQWFVDFYYMWFFSVAKTEKYG